MTAIVYSDARHFRRKFTKAARFRGKRAIMSWCVLSVVGFFAINLVYQVARKPGEMFAPISGSLAKTPAATWKSYGALFQEHSTSIISPEFLAALAQMESDGNPVARTYWRWRWSWNPFEIYRPVSSAVGMFQITDGTFAQARKFCIRNHAVLTDGPWHDPGSCWFNSLYARTVPSHAIEMTAAYLHLAVVDILAGRRITKASAAQKHRLAAVIHLCGAKRSEIFAIRGFRVQPGELCGTHSLERYLSQIELMRKRFAQLAAN
jgi:hypothetical protein